MTPDTRSTDSSEMLAQLRIADPDTFRWVKGRLDLLPAPPAPRTVDLLVSETIQALALEAGLGRAVAEGMLRLLEQGAEARSADFARLVRTAARTGPTLGRILATHLVAVLPEGDRFLTRFMATFECMRAKGTYTLNEPLAVLGRFLADGDRTAAAAYLDLLDAVFSQDLSYNLCLRLVYLLPKAARSFNPARRAFQMEQLRRVAAVDVGLIDAFLDGMPRGLDLLSGQALDQFVGRALELTRKQQSAVRYLGLASKIAQDQCTALQRAVPLSAVHPQLTAYLQARLGYHVALKPLAALAAAAGRPDWLVCSDGRGIYLPAEIDRYEDKERNLELYKVLVRLEAGFFESGSFDFDLQRCCDRYPVVACRVGRQGCAPPDEEPDRDDVSALLDAFEDRLLADDLLNILEQGRVMRAIARRYPGLWRRCIAWLQDEIEDMRSRGLWEHPLAGLFESLVVQPGGPPAGNAGPGAEAAALFEARAPASLEACAELVCLVYEKVRSRARQGGRAAFRFPYSRRLRWELRHAAFQQQIALAGRIRVRLAREGIQVYRSELQKILPAAGAGLKAADLKEVILTLSPGAAGRLDWPRLDLSGLLSEAGLPEGGGPEDRAEAFFYPEWDVHLQDYLQRHARVVEASVPAGADRDFYTRTLQRHRGLVARTRRAFELLKPQGLKLLRKWPEGDAFDYRALLDFVIDRKAGRIPSDRLFIKRLKQERSVAVLLLVDLSRSTSNQVAGSQATVLDVAREALVLFCEALQVVGDRVAAAGFSGSGRHAVDYFRIKDFQEPFDEAVKARISALTPQRGTRMGAAVRHAAARLQAEPARVHLMMIISDGFPNDLGYKADYAIADTRRAIQEARSRSIHVKAVTVNIGSDPRLTELYGRTHHHIIGDVRELPDKLLRLYGTLTRY